MITVIGRGHSGTRAMSHTLSASGVYMGSMLNPSGDKIPPQAMYEACRVLARSVRWKGGLSWDFSALSTGPIAPEFERLIRDYLADVLQNRWPHRGWKIPETTLAYPWIVRMFPDIRYIHWIRDPRDCVVGGHVTDNLADFGLPCPPTDDVRERRAISWFYQYQLMKMTPRPQHCLVVRFEDFVTQQEATLERLEEFLGFPLARIVMRPDSIGRWKTDKERHMFDFFREAMEENGYA